VVADPAQSTRLLLAFIDHTVKQFCVIVRISRLTES
jgi:hypothetical protein